MPSTAPDTPGKSEHAVHVAVGVVENSQGHILIAKRPDHLHQGGLWEFPGGKLETGEQALAALQRELQEEVGLSLKEAAPLIQIPWRYADKLVLLEVFHITAYTGEAAGREGQVVRWVPRQGLAEYTFPAANRAILTAIHLPDRYLITGDFHNTDEFVMRLEQALKQGIRLAQVRAKSSTDEELRALVELARPLCDDYQARLLVNTSIELAQTLNTGVHLNSRRLLACRTKPELRGQYLSASVHNETELRHAMHLGVDFVVISPVLPTRSHPGADTLGWEALAELIQQATIPVYALGGLNAQDIAKARQHGAQGVAAISAFWNQV